MNIWAIIPVKPFLQSKTRLAHILSPAERAAFTTHLLENTIHTLQKAAAINHILVISQDKAVLDLAQRHQTEPLKEKPPYGLKTAVTQAARYVTLQNADKTLIIPADLPFLQESDIQTIINQANSTLSCIICPDESQSGTNALMIPAAPDFTFHYGVGSFQKHRQEAQRLNLVTQTLVIPGVAFDLDTEIDWQIYQQLLGVHTPMDQFK